MKNTIVIFSSDNGGERNVTSNAPLCEGARASLRGRHSRTDHKLAGEIPAGSVSRQLTANIDHYPTLLAAAGAKADSRQKLDGISLAKPDSRLNARTTHFGIRERKLIEDKQLYHLATDPGKRSLYWTNYPLATKDPPRR